MVQIQNTSDIAMPFVKFLVYGEAGSGKTRLCSTTGGTPLIISAESGLLSLRGKKLDYIEIKTLDDLYEAMKYAVSPEAKKFDWICVDSISDIAETVLTSEKSKNKDPRKAYGEMQDTMINIVKFFRDIPDKNVYVTAKIEKTKDEISGMIFYSPSMPGKQIGPQLPYLFDEIFVLRVEKDEAGKTKEYLQTSQCPQYRAKDRSGALDMYESFDLSALHKKISATPKQQ